MDAAIADLKQRIQVLHEQLLYLASSVHDIHQATVLLTQKQAKKKSLENQLKALQYAMPPLHSSAPSVIVDTTPWSRPEPPMMTNPSTYRYLATPPSQLKTDISSKYLWLAEPIHSEPIATIPYQYSQHTLVASSVPPTDSFYLQIHENEPVNQIGSFLKTLAVNTPPASTDTPGIPTNEELFSVFEDIISAQPVPPHQRQPDPQPSTQQTHTTPTREPPKDPDNEPMVEDPEEGVEEVSVKPQSQQAHFPNHESHQVFTFEDTPPEKWCELMISWNAWLHSDRQFYNLPTVLLRFITQMEGRLREWYESLSEYRQLQLQQSPSIDAFVSLIYPQFLGHLGRASTIAREEFVQMKCCSLKKKDLMKHYNRMSQRYFLIGGIDDDNIRQIFLNSFLETLVTEVNKLLKLQKQTIHDVTIAQIYDYINDAVDSLCNQKKFFDDIEKTGKMLKESCNKDNF
ncbi:hypothetical protein LguiB_020729 [Lonicera macranthoides]